MASAWYDKGKEALLNAQINFASDTIRVALVDTTYAFSAAHQYYSSVTGVYGTPQTLASKTTANGLFDAADVVFAALASNGNAAKALVLHQWTGAAGTSRLVAYIEFSPSVTPNGTDFNVAWANGPPAFIVGL